MYMKSMLMQPCERPFDHEHYLFEPLIDGHRLQLSMIENKVQLFTRHHNDVTGQYPELHNVPLKEAADIVLDGEVAYVNPSTGRIEYNILQQRYRMKKTPRIREAKSAIPVCFFVFDILYYNGIDVRERPLIQRKKLLSSILDDNVYYKKMKFVERDGISLFQSIKRLDLEGLVCKRKDSSYSEGRSDSWLKVVNEDYRSLLQA